MTLQYAKNTPAVEEVTTKLKELSLAFKKEECSDSDGITLVDGGQQVIGKKAILEHLDQVKEELIYWHSCAWKP